MSESDRRGPPRTGPVDHPVTGTVRRADLAERLFRLGFSRREAAALVGAVVDEVCDALERGEPVKLAGFGTFAATSRKPRTARDLRSGEAMALEARTTVTFRAARGLREHLTRALPPVHEEGGER